MKRYSTVIGLTLLGLAACGNGQEEGTFEPSDAQSDDVVNIAGIYDIQSSNCRSDIESPLIITQYGEEITLKLGHGETLEGQATSPDSAPPEVSASYQSTGFIRSLPVTCSGNFISTGSTSLTSTCLIGKTVCTIAANGRR